MNLDTKTNSAVYENVRFHVSDEELEGVSDVAFAITEDLKKIYVYRGDITLAKGLALLKKLAKSKTYKNKKELIDLEIKRSSFVRYENEILRALLFEDKEKIEELRKIFSE